MDKSTIETIAGTIAGIISFGNMILANYGWIPLDITSDQIYQFISTVAVIVSAVFIWWKNNNVTPDAKKSQEVLDGLKDGTITTNEVNELLDK